MSKHNTLSIENEKFILNGVEVNKVTGYKIETFSTGVNVTLSFDMPLLPTEKSIDYKNGSEPEDKFQKAAETLADFIIQAGIYDNRSITEQERERAPETANALANLLSSMKETK